MQPRSMTDVVLQTGRADDERFPEHGCTGRTKLIVAWLAEKVDRLVDVGCSAGYGTRFYAQEAREAFGTDPYPEAIAVATRRYPDISFAVATAESLPFPERYFDVAIMADVLEHVTDEVAALNEVERVLRPGGRFIVTVPHSGLFAAFDIDNWACAMKRWFPAAYRAMYVRKEGTEPPADFRYAAWHRHYSLGQLIALLAKSRWNGRYRMRRILRGGLLMEAVASFGVQFAKLAGGPDFAARIADRLEPIHSREYHIDFGPLAANLAVEFELM